MSILFHSLFPPRVIPPKSEIKNWLIKIISNHNKGLGEVNIIFVNDDEILSINRKYLNHDYLTDIITFDYNSEKNIAGDIFISIERVEENAQKFKCTFQSEILRVIVHGIFHLLGYKDKTKKQKDLMRKVEDDALRNFHFSGNR